MKQEGVGVNIILKDGTRLTNAYIFPTGEKGEYSITDKDIIREIFEQNKKELIHFQTKYINGKFYPINIVTWEFVE